MTKSKKSQRKIKQLLCRICKKNPVWRYKNSDGTVCKRCYHKYIWEDRPSAKKERQSTIVNYELEETEELVFDGYTGQFYSANQYPWWM